eukprot:CAMPEP_0198296540 /NCGR_PEP_ID=MMETSP1449-20131203/32966_1 /TAXON_ID=420275 /ORGANISM="Attheya septentrionalis, Strain CCMP2084" /LENGTH=219 /DNA_ID=CAMNT_0043997187 /DNA_START=123 /DNA_END=785 /DNA_ORIENTATION=+
MRRGQRSLPSNGFLVKANKIMQTPNLPSARAAGGSGILSVSTCRNISMSISHRPLRMRGESCGALQNFLGGDTAQHQQKRSFMTEAEFHTVADETLETIQDVVDTDLMEVVGDEEEAEVNVASGVLTLALPPHGTWVLNKQTPNRQIWWSSPLSGPRRYEYDANSKRWVYSRYIETLDPNDPMPSDMDATLFENKNVTIGGALTNELNSLYGTELNLKL